MAFVSTITTIMINCFGAACITIKYSSGAGGTEKRGGILTSFPVSPWGCGPVGILCNRRYGSLHNFSSLIANCSSLTDDKVILNDLRLSGI